MGNCDRMKPYISDYIENSLDPTTKKEFEQVLKSSPELQKLIRHMQILKSGLNNLQSYHCTEDFQIKLRQRLISEPNSLINRQQFVRYSIAVSFIIILVIVTMNISFQNNDQETLPATTGQSDLKIQTSRPVSNPVSETTDAQPMNEGEIDIKTKPRQQAIADSTESPINPESQLRDKNFKYVDQKE